ncbi:hypothetical protein [Longispora albida]|uniref:hypothetical protein n=1 Tax=Longispora albida TaxID=203523 RepID=UPI0012F74292|nr:hypothetical protein [Longispora albida]
MSFSNFVRRARDPGRPHLARVASLCSAVQVYRPLGHRATLSYLTRISGPYEKDEAALLRAVELLTASRGIAVQERAAYGARRGTEKAAGRRRPAPGDYPDQQIWHLDPRDGAMHALWFWLRDTRRAGHRDPGLVRLARECLVTGSLSPADQEALAEVHSVSQAVVRMPWTGAPGGDSRWHTARQRLRIVHHLRTAARLYTPRDSSQST